MLLPGPIQTKHVVEALWDAQQYPMTLQIAARLFQADAGEGFATMCWRNHKDSRGQVSEPFVLQVENYLRDFKHGRVIDERLQRLIDR